MIKYLIKRKVEKEILQNGRKIAFYTGVAVVSTAGVYLSYKTMKKMRNKNEDEIQYLEDSEYELNNLQNDELKAKVDEFNSRRICSENCEDASPEEMIKQINSIKDDKENMKVDEHEYESQEYENYEDDIEK